MKPIYILLLLETFEGKIIGMWWPIFAFATMGMEHCVANMYYLSTALMLVPTGHKYEFNLGQALAYNIIPSTLGCIIGGAVFAGLINYYAYREHAATV
jgi:formate/nitrite transporter FocA (FNT family)